MKGNFITLICTKVNLAFVSIDTWWLDSDATIHVSISIQGCLHCRKPISEEKYVFIGIDTSARVEGFRTFRLLLNIGHFVYLIDTYFVPTLRCNLVHVSTLDKFGYTCMKTILLVLGLYYSTITYIVTPSNLIF